eukprot:TRINITY_DN4379_c0_g1_i1.p1 TRINITY_DN4379_c0_g1~~TRINITY_DN4379_c0_g1_i1.p1  ORF type:complete len:245 (+),score=72.65 TRINITY_DN4379_c0_g1_i1:30-737(+)
MALRRIVARCAAAKTTQRRCVAQRTSRASFASAASGSIFWNFGPKHENIPKTIIPESTFSSPANAQATELNEQLKTLGNAGKYDEAFQLVQDWKKAGKQTDIYTVGIVRDLMGKQDQEKLAADPQYFQKLNKAEFEKRIKSAKFTPAMFTQMAKFMLEQKMWAHTDVLVDVLRQDEIRPEAAGAIAVYDLYLNKYEGRADRALDRIRALKASHDIDAIVYDKILRHATGQSKTDA